MVVDARTPGAALFCGGGQAAEVAPVVVAPEQSDVVRHPHAALIVALHLFVERPALRYPREVRQDEVPNHLPLIRHDAFKQRDTFSLRHGLIAVAAHAQRNDLFKVPGALQSLCPEGEQFGVVLGIIPGMRPVAGAAPLFPGTHHRLMVRSAHDDAVFVSELGVERVVRSKGIVPHRGPKIVGFQPQQQFEHIRVEAVVEAPEFLFGPARQRGGLVV